MLKKVFKWAAIVLGSLLTIAIILYAVVYIATQSRINKVYAVTVKSIAIPFDTASYAKGKHVAENRGCMGCHGNNLAGKEAFLPEGSPLGVLYAPNITSGKGGIQFTDADWLKVLRHGVNPQGKSVWFMPSQEICHISNEEMGQLICFLKQHPPIDNIMPAKEIKPLGRMLVFMDKFPLLPAEIIDHNALYKDIMVPSITPVYGGYLATTCKGCHGNDFKGSPPHGPGQAAIPDITTTGPIAKWHEQDFITALRTGKTPSGIQLSDAMPYKDFTYADDELKAIYQYLHVLR